MRIPKVLAPASNAEGSCPKRCKKSVQHAPQGRHKGATRAPLGARVARAILFPMPSLGQSRKSMVLVIFPCGKVNSQGVNLIVSTFSLVQQTWPLDEIKRQALHAQVTVSCGFGQETNSAVAVREATPSPLCGRYPPPKKTINARNGKQGLFGEKGCGSKPCLPKWHLAKWKRQRPAVCPGS